ncbi:MAG: LytR C-terminal domain-containing protein [Bifidobacteriaceae bacterium]|jgi:hypothetical protein|nr:LytR C-terminal domain-containing protein [Bifidobacteriaceae bacterium]
MNAKDLARMRKRRLILRQTTIFGLLVAVLVVVGAASAAVILGRMDPFVSAPFSSPAAVEEDWGPTPCPPDEASMYPEAALATVNVLNASTAFGAATYLSQALEARGFAIGRVDNAPFEYRGIALIRTGALGINRSYLLLAHAPEGTALTFDGRSDETVDIIIGEEYKMLRSPETVTAKAGTVIPFPAECTPLAELAGVTVPIPGTVPSTSDEPEASETP